MSKHILIILIAVLLVFSCNSNVKKETTDENIIKPAIKKTLNKDSLNISIKRSTDFFADSLLKGRRDIMINYLSKYQLDTCGILVEKDSLLKENFEGIRVIKGITKNKKRDTVFVMPTFNYCDDGESYCFYDKSLPRLYADSYCCHPHNLFVLQDIDEDGIKEIGIYYSSCTSRCKSLRIYSLKEKIWKQIAASTFDIMTKDPDKIRLETLVKKISKGKFRICNFNNGQTTWDTVTFK